MMKVFIKKIVVFLVPILIVWGGLEYFYITVESNYSYKHQIIRTSYDDIETLILGDSHAFFGINPEYLDIKALNLSNISQSLYFDQLLFEKHVDSLSNLQNVIITIGYYSLSQLKNTKEDVWRKYFYRSQMELDVPIIGPFDFKKYSLSMTRRFDNSVSLIHKYLEKGTIIGCDANGWGTYYENTSGELLDIESKATAERHEDFLLNFEENIIRLQSIIAYCKKINCNVYLVDMPVYKGYLELLDSNKLEKITSSCNDLATNNNNVMYIDLRQDSRLEKSDLYDPDHLNHKGAKKYTKIINAIISDPKNDD
ncbi:hypothetical protein [uncultured Aquimarina sp.]|uniref:hypothetical protein n=1 Tax=uncultured Aquimarina sp. TaxID=575652 RepID=UPI00261AAF3A|nr:hypothetical protein [uncultured Aquimarina sp.]